MRASPERILGEATVGADTRRGNHDVSTAADPGSETSPMIYGNGQSSGEALTAQATLVTAIATALLAIATIGYVWWLASARIRERDENSAERAVRAIVRSRIRPGWPTDVQDMASALFDVLEVEPQVISSQPLGDRLHATTVFLLLAGRPDEVLVADEGVDPARLREATKAIVQTCNGSLLAFWNGRRLRRGLPGWEDADWGQWPPRGGPVAIQWIRVHCLAR